jgi:multiple sugar transport system ATP-binding protein
MAQIALNDVTKRFNDTIAVDDLSLTIEDGEFIVFVGPSGCGKSTALRLVAGLEEVTEGVIEIDGRVVNDLPPRDRDVAMVFQNYALYPHMSVFDNMAFGLRMQKLPKAEIKRRVEDASRMLGLEELLARKPRQLSGGQRQRVAMGRAIVREPQAFLMDEPLSNLDAKLRVEMRAEITRLRQRLRTTTIYVTHDQTEAMTMGDRVVLLRQGRLEQVGEPGDIYARPSNIFVAGFIGSPAMNLVRARLVRSDGRTILSFAGQELVVPEQLENERPGLREYLGEEVILGIRPEDLEDAAFAADKGPDRMLKITVSLAEPLGSELVVHFELDTPPVVVQDVIELAADTERPTQSLADTEGRTSCVARVHPRSAARTGERLELAVDTVRLHFFDASTQRSIW